MGSARASRVGGTVFSLGPLLNLPSLPFTSSPPAFVTKLDTVSRTVEEMIQLFILLFCSYFHLFFVLTIFSLSCENGSAPFGSSEASLVLQVQ